MSWVPPNPTQALRSPDERLILNQTSKSQKVSCLSQTLSCTLLRLCWSRSLPTAVRIDSVFSYQQGCFGDPLGSQHWTPANNRKRSTLTSLIHLLRHITFQPSNFPGALLMDCEEALLGVPRDPGPFLSMFFHLLATGVFPLELEKEEALHSMVTYRPLPVSSHSIAFSPPPYTDKLI